MKLWVFPWLAVVQILLHRYDLLGLIGYISYHLVFKPIGEDVSVDLNGWLLVIEIVFESLHCLWFNPLIWIRVLIIITWFIPDQVFICYALRQLTHVGLLLGISLSFLLFGLVRCLALFFFFYFDLRLRLKRIILSKGKLGALFSRRSFLSGLFLIGCFCYRQSLHILTSTQGWLTPVDVFPDHSRKALELWASRGWRHCTCGKPQNPKTPWFCFDIIEVKVNMRN